MEMGAYQPEASTGTDLYRIWSYSQWWIRFTMVMTKNLTKRRLKTAYLQPSLKAQI